MKSLKGETSINIIRSVYFADFLLHLRYAILFCGGDGTVKKFKPSKESYKIN
jgi:hypothetical protein